MAQKPQGCLCLLDSGTASPRQTVSIASDSVLPEVTPMVENEHPPLF